jgi:hypothetical protein
MHFHLIIKILQFCWVSLIVKTKKEGACNCDTTKEAQRYKKGKNTVNSHLHTIGRHTPHTHRTLFLLNARSST